MAPYKWYSDVADLGYPMGPLLEPVSFFKTPAGSKYHRKSDCARARRAQLTEIELPLDSIRYGQLCSACARHYSGPHAQYASACLTVSEVGPLLTRWADWTDKPADWADVLSLLSTLDELKVIARKFDGILSDIITPLLSQGYGLVDELRRAWSFDIENQARCCSARPFDGEYGRIIVPPPTCDLSALGKDWSNLYEKAFTAWQKALKHQGDYEAACGSAISAVSKHDNRTGRLSRDELATVVSMTQSWLTSSEGYLAAAARLPHQVVVVAATRYLTTWKFAATMCGYAAQHIDFEKGIAVLVVPPAMVEWMGGEPYTESSEAAAMFPIGPAAPSDSEIIWSTMVALSEYKRGDANRWSGRFTDDALKESHEAFQLALMNARAVLA